MMNIQKKFCDEHPESNRERQKKFREKHPDNQKNYRRNKMMKNFECDTGFDLICSYCNQYKSKMQCNNIDKLTEEERKEYLDLDEGFNMSKDKEYYICKTCLGKIKSKSATKKINKTYFELSSFPQNLLEKS